MQPHDLPDSHPYGHQYRPHDSPDLRSHSRGFRGDVVNSRYEPRNFPEDSFHLRPHTRGYGANFVKIAPYNPKQQDWFSYKSHFESLAFKAGWDPETKCIKLLGALEGTMTGITSGMGHNLTYDTLIERIDANQGVSNAKDDAEMKLDICQWKGEKEETISMFGERVRQLTMRAHPSYTAADREHTAIRSFINGLPNKNDFRFRMKLQKFPSLTEAVTYAARVEHILNEERQREGHRRPNTIRKMSLDSEDEEEAEDLFVRKVADQVSKTLNQRSPGSNKKPQSDGKSPGKKTIGKENSQDQKPRFTWKTRQNSPCHECGEFGHWRPECPSLPSQTNDSTNEKKKEGLN